MGLKSTLFSTFFAIAIIFLAAAKPAQAGYNYWLMCWVPSTSLGATECARLPSNWRIRGVQKKYCNNRNYCGSSAVSFRVNRRNVNQVSRYADISRRDLGASVTIYTGLYR